jgi:hypothetical protein
MVGIMHIRWNRYQVFKNDQNEWDVLPEQPDIRDMIRAVARDAEEVPLLHYWPDNTTREFFELAEHLPGASVEDAPPPPDLSDAPKDRVY